MLTTTYQNVTDFLHKTQAVLEANEAANNLMLGLCFLMKQRPERLKRQPYFITIEDEAGLALAGVMMPPRQLVIYSERAEIEAACRLVVQNLLANDWAVPGVLGRNDVARRFAETWAEMTGQPFHAGMSQRIYELRRVTPPVGVPGHLRPATAADLDLIIDWAFGFVSEALGESEREKVEKSARRRVADGEVYLWEDGRPVSMAARARSMRTGIVVNFVYTPPDLRGQGYASACVAALSQHLLDSGWHFCALFTDLANPTSNKIYQQIGYMPLIDFQQYRFSA